MTIKDKAFFGYEIHSDSHGYSVVKLSLDKSGNPKTDKHGKVICQTKGYYSTLSGCVRKIAKLATEEEMDTCTLKEYIDRLQEISDRIESAISC